MYSVNVSDYQQWRQTARSLLQRGVPPTAINWECDGQGSLFNSANHRDYQQLPVKYPILKISKSFSPLAEDVSCFRDRGKWSLLYRVAWRLLFDNKQLLGCPVDSDVSRLFSMQKAVRRDRHKMAAFVRFKQVNVTTIDKGLNAATDTLESNKIESDNQQYYCAWFEPDHLIVPSKAPFFVKRFSAMNWSILTPDICAHWDQQKLYFTEGLHKSPTIKDEMDNLWLTYYRHIFNPARVK